MIIQLVRNMFAKKYRLIAALLFISGACCQADNLQPVPSETEDASQFVTLTDVVPDAILEIRYFGTYNFVGARIDGYLEPTALLTREAADSLQAVSKDVMAMGYRLKIYDAYRPQKAVDHFVRWAANVNDTLMKPYFYPALDKSVLFAQGYIAKKSGHTRGITPAQFANRMILCRAMMRHGFKPISSEWWHFTLKKEPFPHTYFTFPVKQLNR